MEQEKTNDNAASAQDAQQTKTATQLPAGQALLAYGSRECDQFFCSDENRFIVRRPISLTKFFTDLDRQVYTVACGGLHTVLLTTNGEVYTFGCNDDGALGRTGDEMQPGKVDLEHPMDMIAAGDSHSVACNSAQSIIFHWGVYRNTNKGNISKSEAPHRIGEDEFRRKKLKKVLSGANHTLALVDGKIYAWGDAEVGILGRMPTSRRKLDQGLKIEGMGVKGVVEDIYTGAYHAFLKKTEKKKNETYSAIYAWGLNNNGQLGVGNTENTHMPMEVTVLRGKNIKNITGGEHHTVALTEDGEVYCFGKNDDGQVGLGKDFIEKEESEDEGEAEEAAAEKKTPAKPAKPPAKSTSKKGKGKGKKGSQKKGDAAEEDKGEEKEAAEKKDEEGAKDKAEGEDKTEAKTEAATETTEKKEGEKEEAAAETAAAAEPEKAKPKGGKANAKKEKEAEREGEEKVEKKSVFTFVKNPHKVELANVEKIFSGSNFNYAVTKENEVYSWGMGENYVLGTKNEDAAYVPTKLDANLFEGKKIVAMGLGAQHVVVVAVDKDDDEPAIDEEAVLKIEEAGKSSKKGTTAKKGEKKGKSTGKDEAEEKDVKKNLSKSLEEETDDKDDKKGQKKSLKRKATEEKEDDSGVKKVKKSGSKDKDKDKESAEKTEDKGGEKMEEEKPEKEGEKEPEKKEKIQEEAQTGEEKKDEGEKAAGDEKKDEGGKMEVEQTENKEGEKKEEKAAEPAEPAPANEESKKIETEEPQKEAAPATAPAADEGEKKENKEAEGEAAAGENKTEEKTA